MKDKLMNNDGNDSPLMVTYMSILQTLLWIKGAYNVQTYSSTDDF